MKTNRTLAIFTFLRVNESGRAVGIDSLKWVLVLALRITVLTNVEIGALLTMKSILRFDVIAALVTAIDVRVELRVVKMIQHHHRGMLRSSQFVELIVISLT